MSRLAEGRQIRAIPLPFDRWTGQGSDNSWFTAANWSAGVPFGSEPVLFGGGATLSVSLARLAGGGIASAGEVRVTGDNVTFTGGTLRLRTTANDPQLGVPVDLRIDGGGSATIAASARIVGQDTVAIGAQGAGSLVIYGKLFDRTGIDAGTVTVSGAGARWVNTDSIDTLNIGNAAGTAMLMVAHGGHVGVGNIAAMGRSSTTMIGDFAGAGSAVVTGAGSLLSDTIIDVGSNHDGTLTIADGGHVIDLNGNVGTLYNGTVTVSGVGSTWTNLSEVTIGAISSFAKVVVTDHGTLTWGSFGLAIRFGSLQLDSTAVLGHGQIGLEADGGLSALATSGVANSTVTVSNSIVLGANPYDPFSVYSFVGSAAGAQLRLTGSISDPTGTQVLAIGAGDVVLAHANNPFIGTSIFQGTVEVAAAGAAGTGGFAFAGSQSATLRIDAGVPFANLINGFGNQDTIDLTGIAFGPSTQASFVENGTMTGGMLTVSSGSVTQALNLAGQYGGAGFHVASDGHGGTAVTYPVPLHQV